MHRSQPPSRFRALDPTATWAQLTAGLSPGKEFKTLLSPAEQMVAREIAKGFSNKEIARVLGKSGATVKAQVASILKKVELPTRARLVVWLLTGARHEPI